MVRLDDPDIDVISVTVSIWKVRTALVNNLHSKEKYAFEFTCMCTPSSRVSDFVLGANASGRVERCQGPEREPKLVTPVSCLRND